MTVSTLFAAGRQQFVDAGGKPIVGGKLYIGKADQDPKLVPLVVYADRQKTVPLAQPVLLDSLGRTTVSVWVGESYSYVIDDAYDVQQDEEQHIEVVDIQELVDEAVDEALATVDFGYKNLIVNGAMSVTHQDSVNLSSVYQEGAVAALWGLGLNASAGTMEHGEDDSFGDTGQHMIFAGVTLPNLTDYLSAQFRVLSRDAVSLVNKAATFSVLVDHDIGATTDFRIYAEVADAEDDFSSTTIIDLSDNIPVQSGIAQKLTFTVDDMGNCSNGVAITVRCAAGQITDKNIRLTMAQLEEGDSASSFQNHKYETVRAALDYDAIREYADNAAESSATTATENLAKRDPSSPYLNGIGNMAVLSSGSGNWTVPDGVYRIKVRACGAGAGGEGQSGNGGNGGDTSFGGITAGGGKNSGIGGVVSGGPMISVGGGDAMPSSGGFGANSFFGGGRQLGNAEPSVFGAGGMAYSTLQSGGAGAYFENIFSCEPGDDFAYGVGEGGAGGTGAIGNVGSPGGSGIIIIEY